MSNPQDDKLKEEIHFGQVAKRANDTFIKGFIASKRKNLYEHFVQASVQDPMILQEIKRQHLVLDALEDEIQTVINTGKMAIEMLNELEEPTEGEL